jgi:hypothetical protein
MAQHSPDLFSSDIGGTMRDEYKSLSSFGISPEDILSIFKKYFLSSNPTKNEQNLFWLIMARIQVNYGVLCDEVKNEALKVIASGEDIQQWEAYVNIEKYLFSYPALTQELIDNTSHLKLDQNDNLEDNIVNMFKQLEKSKQIEIEENETLPDEVRSYYQNKDFSKIMVFGPDGKKYLKKRIQVLEKLKNDIENFVYNPKKLTIKVELDPKWKIGDIYAMQFDDLTQTYHKDYLVDEIGKYIVFEVSGINRKPISEILPEYGYHASIFIQAFLYLDYTIPTIEQLKHLDYIPKENASLFSPKPVGPKYLLQKPQVFQVSFYQASRIFKKLNFIKLKEGSIDVSETPVSGTGTLLVFISSIQSDIAFKVKKYLESIDLSNMS